MSRILIKFLIRFLPILLIVLAYGSYPFLGSCMYALPESMLPHTCGWPAPTIVVSRSVISFDKPLASKGSAVRSFQPAALITNLGLWALIFFIYILVLRFQMPQDQPRKSFTRWKWQANCPNLLLPWSNILPNGPPSTLRTIYTGVVSNASAARFRKT